VITGEPGLVTLSEGAETLLTIKKEKNSKTNNDKQHFEDSSEKFWICSKNGVPLALGLFS